MHTLGKVTLLLSILFLTSSFGNEIALAVEFSKSRGKRVTFVTGSLNKHLLSIKRDGKNVRIVTDGQYVSSGDKSPEFVLKPGESFERIPDRHSTLSLRLLSADSASVRFIYEEKFDQRSFGRNLIDIDTGEVEVSIRGDAATKPAEISSPEATLNLVENRLIKAGFRMESNKKVFFADEEFLEARFLKSGTESKVTSKNNLPLTLMIKDCPQVGTCKQVTARMAKLLKGEQIRNSDFDDYYDIPFGAYVGKRALFRKGKRLFVIVFYDEAQRRLLQESCSNSLK